jgi:hypothetical protein
VTGAQVLTRAGRAFIRGDLLLTLPAFVMSAASTSRITSFVSAVAFSPSLWRSAAAAACRASRRTSAISGSGA